MLTLLARRKTSATRRIIETYPISWQAPIKRIKHKTHTILDVLIMIITVAMQAKLKNSSNRSLPKPKARSSILFLLANNSSNSYSTLYIPLNICLSRLYSNQFSNNLALDSLLFQ